MIAQLLAAAALGLHAGPAVHLPTVTPQTATSIGQGTSRNWAGYVAEGDIFNRVTATWIEPHAHCGTTPDAMALFWVGFDGWNNDTVEQGGSYARCSSGTASYWLWWEMYPQTSINPVMPIHAGDKITATVQYVAPTYVITETDDTTGGSNEQDVQCQVISGNSQCFNSSAEVIAEDPMTSVYSSTFFPLDDYGTVKFSGATLHDHHGHTGGFTNSHWLPSRITESDGSQVMAQPSGLTNTGRNFSVTWKATS